MADHESFEERFRRLRQGTEHLVPPQDLVERIAQVVLAQPPSRSWPATLLRVGRPGLIFAALVAAVFLVLAQTSERGLEDALVWTTLLEGP